MRMPLEPFFAKIISVLGVLFKYGYAIGDVLKLFMISYGRVSEHSLVHCREGVFCSPEFFDHGK